jgi:colanic acid/amylovoran biosynthesis glycosyltransferase
MSTKKADLVIFTISYPYKRAAEIWLHDELKIIHSHFNHIYIYPMTRGETYFQLPDNCRLISGNTPEKKNIRTLFLTLKTILSDFAAYPDKKNFFLDIRRKAALFMLLNSKAQYLMDTIPDVLRKKTTILYAYWAAETATIASIIKSYYSSLRVISRAHNYEIYEDRFTYGMIDFRKFQLNSINDFYMVSTRGMLHMKKSNPRHTDQMHRSYMGTMDHGINPFLAGKDYSIVTCCHLNAVKRLHLVTELLRSTSQKITWHILGDGPELENIKKGNADLPAGVQVIYHGFLNQEQIIHFYQHTPIHLYISTSLYEGIPISIMEAISFSIPVFSTDTGGCREICTDQTGILIEKNFDPKMAAQKLNDFLLSEKNSVDFRTNVKKFWNEHFNAQTNYAHFSEQAFQIN